MEITTAPGHRRVRRSSDKGIKQQNDPENKGLAPRGVMKIASQLLWFRYRFYFGSA